MEMKICLWEAGWACPQPGGVTDGGGPRRAPSSSAALVCPGTGKGPWCIYLLLNAGTVTGPLKKGDKSVCTQEPRRKTLKSQPRSNLQLSDFLKFSLIDHSSG